jgi:hypothetical protein
MGFLPSANWACFRLLRINFFSSTLFSNPASLVRITLYGVGRNSLFSAVRPSCAGDAAKKMDSLKMALCACCLSRSMVPLWCMRPVYQKMDSTSVGDCGRWPIGVRGAWGVGVWCVVRRVWGVGVWGVVRRVWGVGVWCVVCGVW